MNERTLTRLSYLVGAIVACPAIAHRLTRRVLLSEPGATEFRTLAATIALELPALPTAEDVRRLADLEGPIGQAFAAALAGGYRAPARAAS